MSTTSDKIKAVQKSFEAILSFDDKTDKVDHHERMLMHRFLSEIQKMMEEKGMTKKKLASDIGTSASFITQLFRGDKVINLNTLAKIEVAYDILFEVAMKDSTGEKKHVDIDEDETIKYLNKKAGNEGRWIFYNYGKTIPARNNYQIEASLYKNKNSELKKALG
jgi:ribosome-binding protein aMBF1 (putative translation factor)